MADFNIPQLFSDVFGVTLDRAYSPQLSDGVANMPTFDYSGVKLINSTQEAYQLSSLGTPIIFPITFKAGAYNVFSTTGEIVKRQMGDFRLPIAAIADFRRSKIVGKTRAVSGNSTVKETYGFDDWKIQIKGFCITDEAQPQSKFSAMDQEEELLYWEELADSIEVQGELFEIRGIYNIVIEDVSMPYVRGNKGLRPFVITAVSDTPAELIL